VRSQGRRKSRDDANQSSIFILHCGKKLAHLELPGNF
jgi:hypothetical protein